MNKVCDDCLWLQYNPKLMEYCCKIGKDNLGSCKYYVAPIYPVFKQKTWHDDIM